MCIRDSDAGNQIADHEHEKRGKKMREQQHDAVYGDGDCNDTVSVSYTHLEALARVRLVPKRLRFVHQTAQAVPSAVLVECRKGGSAEGLSVEPPLLVQSEEYNKIYKK